MPRTSKQRFRADVRRALALLRVKVDASGTGLDEEHVLQLMDSASIWLSSGVMEHFRPEDWADLPEENLAKLRQHVNRFAQVARAVNPRENATGKVKAIPTTATQRNHARKSLLAIARLIGEDVRSRVLSRKESIRAIAARHGACNPRLFGSVARDEADAESDVDILVDLEPGRSLFDLGRLQVDLQELVGCRVDVVTERSLPSRDRQRILSEAEQL